MKQESNSAIEKQASTTQKHTSPKNLIYYYHLKINRKQKEQV